MYTNQVFLEGAKTALTIFLKFCIPPYFGLNFLMKKNFDPPKRIMTSFWGSKNPENQFFRPKSDIFHPISTKLSKSVKNIKTHILVFLIRIGPLYDVIKGVRKLRKSVFWT